MNVVELHPEDLLDKEIEGELSLEERSRLDTHLENCSACNLERNSRAAFKADFESIGRAMQLQGMLTLAMNSGPASPRARAPLRPTFNRKLRPLLLIAAAMTLFATGAFAARYTAVGRVFIFPRTTSPAPAAAASERGESGAVRGLVHRGSNSAETKDVPSESPTPDALGVGNSVSSPAFEEVPRAPQHVPVLDVERPSVSSSIHRIIASTPSNLTVSTEHRSAPSNSSPVVPVVTTSRRAPASLFEDGNDARRRGDYPAAIALYRELTDQFGATAEAKSAEGILGRLLLDRGDALEALRHFNGYLARGDGVLREASLVGRAEALERLRRGDAARGAWRDLLSEFPNSVSAGEARRRLGTSGVE